MTADGSGYREARAEFFDDENVALVLSFDGRETRHWVGSACVVTTEVSPVAPYNLNLYFVDPNTLVVCVQFPVSRAGCLRDPIMRLSRG